MPTQDERLYHVVETLKEHQVRIADLYDIHHAEEKLVLVEFSKLKVEIAKLKVKAGTWGAIGGGIPVIVAIAMYVLRGLL